MREFMVLMGELIFIAALQFVVIEILDESGQKRYIKIVNIACVVIGYFLLLRYVYNNFGEITSLVNMYF
ncbi:MAG: hypothetical protein FWC70_00760 [Defluviitaleaceae bacterium]|nr:hypothetical protein [Defluviitaleaceae bacterium]